MRDRQGREGSPVNGRSCGGHGIFRCQPDSLACATGFQAGGRRACRQRDRADHREADHAHAPESAAVQQLPAVLDAARILAEFADALSDEQKVPNTLAELGRLTLLPDALVNG